MACYAQIRNTNSHILAKGKGLSSEHPRFYSIMRGRSISKTKEGSYVFSGENISKCKNAHQSKGLIKRIHQVVFHDQSISESEEDRNCHFNLKHRNPQYTCLPTKLGGLMTRYSFYPTSQACEAARNQDLQRLQLTEKQEAGLKALN